jgi:uncharacterized protein YcnI
MMKISWRLPVRMVAVGAVCAMTLVSQPGIASAHVTANPSTAQQGSFTKVSFRVPNERDAASTTKLEINFPPDHPIAYVSARAVPGWTSTVQKTTLAQPIKTAHGEISETVSKITWSGGTVSPGGFEEFDVSLGPLPTDTTELVFKALQTYDNGEVVRWIDTAPEDAPEPEHPAPVLKLAPANALPAALTTTAQAPTATGIWGVLLGSAGIVLGSIGIVLGLRNRRNTAGG